MSKSINPDKSRSLRAAVVCALILMPCLSSAGEIYGRVALNGKVYANARIVIVCPNFRDEQTTNSNGAYRSRGPSGEAQCTISAGNASNSVPVFTSQGRTRVNLEVRGNRLYRR